MKRLTRLTPLVAVAALAIALLAPGQAFAKKSLGLSSGEFNYSLSAGDTGKGSLTVSNEGDEPLKVLVYAGDESVSPTGTVSYKVPNRDSRDFGNTPSSWIKVQMPAESKSFGNTPYLELAPGKAIPISFDFVVPQGVAPGDHQILIFFEMFEPPAPKSGANAAISGRIGARVKVRVSGQVIDKLTVAPFTVGGFVIGDKVPYSFTIQNAGNINKPLAASLSLVDSNEAERAKQQVLDKTVVYPSNIRQVSGDYKPAGGAFGHYTVRLTVDTLDDKGKPVGDAITKDRSVWLVPVWAVAAAGAAVLVLLVLIVWLAGRKRRAAKKAAVQPPAPAVVAEVQQEEPRAAEQG